MTRFNTRTARAQPASRVTSTGRVLRTYEGGRGRERDARSELFLLAVSNLVAQQTFYETGSDRDDRYARLVRELAVTDPAWTAGLLGWLRGEGNLRTAAVVGAAEYVKARLDADVTDGPSNRRVVDSVLQRPDEPGELLAYWTATYGRALPKPVKRGVADAVRRLYGGKALLKYDTATRGFRFGDVLNLVHAAPDPAKPWQGELFRYALDRRHHPDTAVPPASDPVLTAHRALMALPAEERRAVVTAPDAAERLAAAGMTWEALAGWLRGPMDRAAWEAVIPSMGAMALLRNLRNFDEAGVGDEVAARVAARISDPEQVARSRQFRSGTSPRTGTRRRCAGRTRWSRRSATRWPTCPRCPAARWCSWTVPARCSSRACPTAPSSPGPTRRRSSARRSRCGRRTRTSSSSARRATRCGSAGASRC